MEDGRLKLWFAIANSIKNFNLAEGLDSYLPSSKKFLCVFFAFFAVNSFFFNTKIQTTRVELDCSNQRGGCRGLGKSDFFL